MPAIVLEDNEWGQVMAILATAPWRDANPLLMKIGGQLQTQRMPPPTKDVQAPPVELRGNGQQEAEP